MDPVVIGLLVVAGAVVFFVIEPVISGIRAPSGRDEDEPSESDYRKRAVLLALRDVEYDYHTGKLDEKDYRVLRGQLSKEALEALRHHSSGTATTGNGSEPSVDGDDPLEAEIRQLRSSLRKGKADGCPECGTSFGTDDRFCGECGAPLPAGVEDGGSEG